MSNYKMTIKNNQVFKLKIGHTGTPTDMGQSKKYFFISPISKPLYVGRHNDCIKFIESMGAEYYE